MKTINITLIPVYDLVCEYNSIQKDGNALRKYTTIKDHGVSSSGDYLYPYTTTILFDGEKYFMNYFPITKEHIKQVEEKYPECKGQNISNIFFLRELWAVVGTPEAIKRVNQIDKAYEPFLNKTPLPHKIKDNLFLKLYLERRTPVEEN